MVRALLFVVVASFTVLVGGLASIGEANQAVNKTNVTAPVVEVAGGTIEGLAALLVGMAFLVALAAIGVVRP